MRRTLSLTIWIQMTCRKLGWYRLQIPTRRRPAFDWRQLVRITPLPDNKLGFLRSTDNYQGEESDIVVASLCRSNSDNSIGFMSAPERLNVLISRARNGLILIGNSSTFEQSKKGGELWTKFLNLVRRGKYMYSGLPVRCQRHPDWTREIQQPDEFDVYSPDGGCTEPWFVSVFGYELFLISFIQWHGA